MSAWRSRLRFSSQRNVRPDTHLVALLLCHVRAASSIRYQTPGACLTPRHAIDCCGNMNRADLEQYLHEHIPVSHAMGISVVTASTDEVELRAALAPNVNHRNTAFGGSVAALAILAGWSLLRIGLDGHIPIPQIVIQRSTMEYSAPVLADFDAVCRRPSDAAWQRFMSAFTRRGRGRLSLAVDVLCDGNPVGHLTGVFVAMDADQGAGH